MGTHNSKPAQNNVVKPGDIVVIQHDEYSRDQDIPNDILKAGQKAKVVRMSAMHQSRPDHPKVYVTKVQFADGTVDAYHALNVAKAA